MVQKSTNALADLYLADETAWLLATAELIREGQIAEIDFPHLAEYLDDMAKRDKREVKSRLAVLAAHLLKWMHQPKKRSRSWRHTIVTQRQELNELLASGTLRNHAEIVLDEAYANAIEQAAAETGLKEKTFPSKCIWTLDELLSADIASE
jgi:hypothetical protein